VAWQVLVEERVGPSERYMSWPDCDGGLAAPWPHLQVRHGVDAQLQFALLAEDLRLTAQLVVEAGRRVSGQNAQLALLRDAGRGRGEPGCDIRSVVADAFRN